MIGCGSFARVYLGDLHGRQVAVKVMSSRGCEAAFTGDLFESLVSANMHHPNVVDIFEVLIVQQPAATVASLSSFAKTSSSKMMGYNPEVGKGLPPRLGVDSNLDDLVSFLENHRLGAHPPQELACLASNPQSPSGISAFALDNGRFEPAAVVMERASNQQTCSRPPQANVVRGGLGLDGTYKPATRAVSMPLPLQLSPFDTALSRAEDATGSDSAGREGSAAGRALITIKRHSSDAAAWPKAERCFRRSSCDGPGSYSPDAGSSWSGSSGGTDAGGPHSCGGAPSVTSPLPEPPQPPRSAQVLLVMELADQRSLHSAISKGRLSGNMKAILLCAMDVAAGMAYLHSMGVIHADLKPGNVLLMSAPITPSDPRGFTCKIADFGMARLLATGDSHAETDKLGSLPYVAPEVLQRGEVARPADVYSFAVLLLELWCGSAAYAGENNHGVLYSAFCGRRPCIPDDMPAAYRELLEACWAADSEQRPSFQAAHAHLASMLAAARSR
ncbi:hypothetical protein WJX75_009157 [Coccomyxa subellipsoidea]|uniref:Protein kinase domain-containing protein n=1 Tax=Coccomyxa subellipsoidea TaxID=248742 RepID=A0ABR2YMS8_9CHLO